MDIRKHAPLGMLLLLITVSHPYLTKGRVLAGVWLRNQHSDCCQHQLHTCTSMQVVSQVVGLKFDGIEPWLTACVPRDAGSSRRLSDDAEATAVSLGGGTATSQSTASGQANVSTTSITVNGGQAHAEHKASSGTHSKTVISSGNYTTTVEHHKPGTTSSAWESAPTCRFSPTGEMDHSTSHLQHHISQLMVNVAGPGPMIWSAHITRLLGGLQRPWLGHGMPSWQAAQYSAILLEE